MVEEYADGAVDAWVLAVLVVVDADLLEVPESSVAGVELELAVI